MADEIDMLTDMDFEQKLNDLGNDEPELIRFIARQQFSSSKVLLSHGKRIKKLENRNKKTIGIVGAAGVILATIVTATIDYFLRRGS